MSPEYTVTELVVYAHPLIDIAPVETVVISGTLNPESVYGPYSTT